MAADPARRPQRLDARRSHGLAGRAVPMVFAHRPGGNDTRRRCSCMTAAVLVTTHASFETTGIDATFGGFRDGRGLFRCDDLLMESDVVALGGDRMQFRHCFQACDHCL